MPCRFTAASLPGLPAKPAAQGRGVLFSGSPYLSGGVCLSLQLIVNGISLGAVYALIAVGFALVFSILKFSNFAHGGMISAARTSLISFTHPLKRRRLCGLRFFSRRL